MLWNFWMMMMISLAAVRTNLLYQLQTRHPPRHLNKGVDIQQDHFSRRSTHTSNKTLDDFRRIEQRLNLHKQEYHEVVSISTSLIGGLFSTRTLSSFTPAPIFLHVLLPSLPSTSTYTANPGQTDRKHRLRQR